MLNVTPTWFLDMEQTINSRRTIINMFTSHIRSVMFVGMESSVGVKFQPNGLVGLFNQAIETHYPLSSNITNK